MHLIILNTYKIIHSIVGQKLSLAHQYALVSIASFPLFYLAGAGQVVFWILGMTH